LLVARSSWLLLALAACAEGGDAGSTLVVGLTSDYTAGDDLERLEVDMRADGVSLLAESRALGDGAMTFPSELRFDDIDEGARLALTLRGLHAGVPRVVRHVETTMVRSAPRLLRVHLEELCDLQGEIAAPSCDDVAETCISGQCRSAFADPSWQVPYDPAWPTDMGDACKPFTSGPPSVTVGLGQADYYAASDYDLAEVEAGPQGGHHIWVAVRVKGIHQSGTITTVSGEVPSLALGVEPLRVVFTMDPDEGGYCKLSGLRFQLDAGEGIDIEPLLGREAKVTVTLTDVDGAIVSDDLWVTLSDYII
jgi:hypothetical protein